MLPTMSCKAYSTIDTLPSPGVKLTLKQAKEVYKELVMYDAAKSIDSLKSAQILDYKAIIDMQRREIATVEERERNLKLAFEGQTLLLADQKSRSGELEKMYKRSVRWGRLKIILIPAAGVAGYFIAKSIK